jgi:uncharacterized protein
MTTKLTAEQLAKQCLDAFLAKDMKGWSELCDPNVVVEFPFAPEGSVARLEGRTAIYEYLKNYPSMIDIKEITSTRVFATIDPNTAIIEWSVSGKVIANDNPYVMSYATFVTARDGLIVNYREYWNPAAFMKAMAGARFD